MQHLCYAIKATIQQQNILQSIGCIGCAEGTFGAYSANRKGFGAHARDINVMNVTLLHMDAILLEETNGVLNHGNRYALVGRNGCRKVSCC